MPISQSNTMAAVFKVDSEILTWNTAHHCNLMIFVAHAYAKMMQDYWKNITAIVKIYKLSTNAWNTNKLV